MKIIRVLTFVLLFPFFFPAQAGKKTHNFKEVLKPFRKALLKNDIESFRELAENIDDVNVQAWANRYSILYSISSGINATRDIRFLEILIEVGADVHAKTIEGRTALHNVARFGTPEHVRVLLRAGADINETDIYGRTMLYEALINVRDVKFIEMLLEAGADVNIPDEKGQTALHAFARVYAGIGQKFLKKQIGKKLFAVEDADINARDNEGRTPLHHLMHSPDLEIITLFLKKRADIMIKDEAGQDVYTLISESKGLTAREKMTLLTMGIEVRCF